MCLLGLNPIEPEQSEHLVKTFKVLQIYLNQQTVKTKFRSQPMCMLGFRYQKYIMKYQKKFKYQKKKKI